MFHYIYRAKHISSHIEQCHSFRFLFFLANNKDVSFKIPHNVGNHVELCSTNTFQNISDEHQIGDMIHYFFKILFSYECCWTLTKSEVHRFQEISPQIK